MVPAFPKMGWHHCLRKKHPLMFCYTKCKNIFFRGSVTAYAVAHRITEAMVRYIVPNFCADTALSHVRWGKTRKKAAEKAAFFVFWGFQISKNVV